MDIFLKPFCLYELMYDVFSGHQSWYALQRRRRQNGKDSKRYIHEGVQRGSSENGNRGRIDRTGGRVQTIKSTLVHWVKIAKEGTVSTGRKQRPVTGEEMELARLKREITELKMERDILRKCRLENVYEMKGGIN